MSGEVEFKKPRRNIRKRESSPESEEEDLVASSGSTIQDTMEIQRARKRPSGISIECLAVPNVKAKENTSKADPLKLKTGGFVDVATLKRELSVAESIETIGTSFASETNRCDVDLPMLTYIEENLAKRKGLPTKEEEEAVVEKKRNPEDALYDLPEHIKALTKSVKKEETMSSSMLSGIPEVDLGIEAKIRNIEATEEAKQRLLQERLKRRDHVSAFVPTNVAVNFVQHNRLHNFGIGSNANDQVVVLECPLLRVVNASAMCPKMLVTEPMCMTCHRTVCLVAVLVNIEDHQPRTRAAAPTPKPTPLRVGDADRPKTLVDDAQPTIKSSGAGGPPEKATDDFHFEKFKKFNRRF